MPLDPYQILYGGGASISCAPRKDRTDDDEKKSRFRIAHRGPPVLEPLIRNNLQTAGQFQLPASLHYNELMTAPPVPPANSISSRFSRPDRIGMWLGPVFVIALIAWMSGWSQNRPVQPEFAALWVLVSSLPLALLWIAAAVGMGWPLRILLAGKSKDGFFIQAGVGVGILLFFDVALGISGLLQVGGSLGAWIVLLVGLLLLAEQYRRWFASQTRPEIVWPLIIWTVAPALATLLIASCSAPSWLWATEFGGYDALSYHLQLPKEWLALGSITPLDHNVYSHMPGFVEAAFYHLAVLRGDGIDSVYAAQMLHACFGVISAILVGRLGFRYANSLGGFLAGAVLLGTPWVIVVGSLGYNELAVVLMLATGLLIVDDYDLPVRHQAALLGIVIGAACGAKLTSIGFVALPLVLLALWNHPITRWPGQLVVMGLFVVMLLSPYLIANGLDTGNPLFPFATGILGTGHWTAEQVATWTTGHQVEGGIAARLTEGFHQFARYGIGRNPYRNEPWIPQWSILPLLTVLAFSLGLSSEKLRGRSLRLLIVLVVQLLFWLFFTHVKSRFMLPAIVPMSLSVSLAYSWLRETFPSNRLAGLSTLCAGFLLLLWCSQPLYLFSREKNGNPAAMIDMSRFLSGREYNAAQRRELGSTQFAAIYLNYLLDPGAKVLMVGHAAPLYLRKPVVYQTTWDRGPLSRIMREHPDDRQSWISALRDMGFTHLLVDPTMLRIWEQSGWNDPLITSDRILNAADLHATLEHRYPDGTVIYRLTPPAPVR